MIKFFVRMITANSGVSSKRFIALYSLLLLTIAISVSFAGINVDESIYYVLAGLIVGQSALTLRYDDKNKL